MGDNVNVGATSRVRPPSFLILGVGGIGSIYSLLIKLGSPKSPLTFIARSNYEQIAKNGIQIESAKFGKHHLSPTHIYRTTLEASRSGSSYDPGSALSDSGYDYILCCTKVLPTENASLGNMLQHVMMSHTTIVLLQNGLGIERPLAEAFPHNTLISAAAYIGVWQDAPGFITHSNLERLDIGTYLSPTWPLREPANVASVAYQDTDSMIARKKQDRANLVRFVEILEHGGGVCTIVASIQQARWQKLVWNASFNPTCTIFGMHTIQILSNPPATSLVLAAMSEIIDAAEACGFKLPASVVEMNMEATRKLGAYRPSMMLDHLAGRDMEVDVILGSAIVEAEKAGVQVPTLIMFRRVLDVYNYANRERREGLGKALKEGGEVS